MDPATCVAFQGEHGAFSEEAACKIFGDVPCLPCATFDDMFAAVLDRRAIAAMAPIENTLAGSIIRNFDLLEQHPLEIAGEVVLRVVHNLIAPPGVALADVRRVHSHPVALAQCERFLREHPALRAEPAYDTAGAVKMVMAGGRRDEAAIASASAARVYGGEILAAGIESNPENYTRFLVLCRPADRGRVPGADAHDRPRKTSVVLRLAHRPGALYRALGGFAAANIDLTKIESRPIEGRPFEYSFYLDFAGDSGAPEIRAALERLRTEAEALRILGSYPRGGGS